MKISTMITIVVIILLILGGLYFLSGNSEDNNVNNNTELEQTDNSEFPNLETNEQILDEIDSTLEQIE